MKRRGFIENSLALGLGRVLTKFNVEDGKTQNPVLRIAHITDVHIKGSNQIPLRADKYLESALHSGDIDFVLNGGDAIFDASYERVTREMVKEQWAVWDEFISKTKLKVYSCIGNHDPWWKAPSESDEMYGLDYAAKRLKMPHRYYSFDQAGWHFVILDGNHKGTTLDDPQMEWLKNDLAGLAANTPVLIMSHYPILSSTCAWSGGQHGDYKALKALFFQYRDKVKVCLSGHQHLADEVSYNGISYFCNGSLSGFWWGEGDKESAGKYFYQETPPGYAILSLYADGKVENQYHSLELI